MKTLEKEKRKKKKRTIKKLLVLLLCLCLLGAVAVLVVNRHVVQTGSDRILSAEEAASLRSVDCILVLGAGLNSDKSPSYMLEDRLEEGVALFEAGVSDRLLMSGDHGRTDYDEVSVMKQYAITEGVPSEMIFMDHAGFSTYESLYRARDIFDADKIVIVTQKYHLYRALYTAEKLGIDAYGVAAEEIRYSGQTMREIREMLARAKDFVYCIVRPQPTYLGDAIPVNGNGDLTNDQ